MIGDQQGSEGGDKKLPDVIKLYEPKQQLRAARARTTEIEARLNQIEAALKAYQADTAGNVTALDKLNNPIITNLRVQYLELSSRVADWSAKYGKDHAATVRVRKQMQQIRRSILGELTRILEIHKSKYAIAKNREVELTRKFETLGGVPCYVWRDVDPTLCYRRSMPDELRRKLLVDELTRIKKIYESEYATTRSRTSELRRQLEAAERHEEDSKRRLERLMKMLAELS